MRTQTARWPWNSWARTIHRAIPPLGHALIGNSYPLRCAEGLATPPFFIIGSGRSGTTLLRAALMQERSLFIPPESYALGPVARDFPRLRMRAWPHAADWVVTRFLSYPGKHWELPDGALRQRLWSFDDGRRGCDAVVYELFSEYMRIEAPAAVRWGDKTPLNTLNLPWIQDLFPSAQYIHLLRDGRDVVASYLDAGLYSDPEAAATRWLDSVKNAERLGRKLLPGQFLEVRYEELVLDPPSTLNNICDFLGVQFSASMLEFWRRPERLGDAHLPHHQGVHGPISKGSVAQWRNRLPEEVHGMVERILGDTLRRLGYAE